MILTVLDGASAVFSFYAFCLRRTAPKATQARGLHSATDLHRSCGEGSANVRVFGVTPPPIISAIEPVTTTEGFFGSVCGVLGGERPLYHAAELLFSEACNNNRVARVEGDRLCSGVPK